MGRPVALDADRCLQCGAPVWYALVTDHGDVSGRRLEVALDVDPTADGTLWVDLRGWARAVDAPDYRPGEARYTPHVRTCAALAALGDACRAGTAGAGR